MRIKVAHEMEHSPSMWMYLIIFLLLFATDSGIANYSYIGYYGKILIPIGLSILYIMMYPQCLRRINGYFFFAVAIIATSILLNTSSLGISIGYLCTLLFAYIFCTKTQFEDVCVAFLRIMRFLAGVSLVLYVCVTMLGGLRDYIPVINYNYNVIRPIPYYDIFFSHMPVNFWNVNRNYGVFWEPGTFQFYLNFALLLSVFRSNRKQFLLDLCLLGITIVTTFSTTGYISLCMVLICYVVCKRSDLKTKTSTTLIIFLVIIIACLFYFEEIYDYVFYKFEETNLSDNGSLLSRVLSITGNLRLMLTNPLLGVGYSNSGRMFEALYEGITNKQLHQTNTMTNYYASFGLLVGGYFTLLWWKTIRKIMWQGRYPLLVFITVFAMSAGENLVPSMLVNVFMIYGLKSACERTETRGLEL